MIKFFHAHADRSQGSPGDALGVIKITTQGTHIQLDENSKQLLYCLQLSGGASGELWCPHANSRSQFCRIPFGFLCLCMLAQSSLFPTGSDAHTLCRIALGLWNVSVGYGEGKKNHVWKINITIKITSPLFNPQSRPRNDLFQLIHFFQIYWSGAS